MSAKKKKPEYDEATLRWLAEQELEKTSFGLAPVEELRELTRDVERLIPAGVYGNRPARTRIVQKLVNRIKPSAGKHTVDFIVLHGLNWSDPKFAQDTESRYSAALEPEKSPTYPAEQSGHRIATHEELQFPELPVEEQLARAEANIAEKRAEIKALVQATVRELGRVRVATLKEGRDLATLLNNFVRRHGLWFKGPKGTVGNLSFQTGPATREKPGEFFVSQFHGGKESLSDGFGGVRMEDLPPRQPRKIKPRPRKTSA
jgi:hypothetical protein